MQISLQPFECVHCSELAAGVALHLRGSVLLFLLHAPMLALILPFQVILKNNFVSAILVHFKYTLHTRIYNGI
jgi:hypothetical protein